VITDHRYDAGWPREDSQGCIYEVVSLAPGGSHDCGRPESEHALSEYPNQRPARNDGVESRRAVVADPGLTTGWCVAPGDMHEWPPYRGQLDWPDPGHTVD
jgi:hypothetical protein